MKLATALRDYEVARVRCWERQGMLDRGALPIQNANAFEVYCPRPGSEVNLAGWFLRLYPCSADLN